MYTFAANSVTLLRLQTGSSGPNGTPTPRITTLPSTPPANTATPTPTLLQTRAAMTESLFLPVVTR